MLTLAQAAKEIGLTRPGLLKAIQAGRVSAHKDDKGRWQIDPAELFRVYKPVTPTVAPTEVVTSEQQLLAQELELTRQLLAQVTSERDHLRQSLDKALSLLTHQPDTAETAAPTGRLERVLKGFFR